MKITSDRAQLALDTILQKPTKGIPTWQFHPMEHAVIDRLAEADPGSYVREPEKTYLAMLHRGGVCLLDQYIPDNPLSMGDRGFESAEHGVTTGAEQIVCDGIVIDGPEAVIEHMERFVFPALQEAASAEFDEDARVKEILDGEAAIQETLGPDILKSGYGFVGFPGFAYGTYGYEHYFTAYGLYPEIMERHFSLQADVCLRNNRAAARAYTEGDLPPLYRLDHDMAGTHGTLASIKSLERIWFPHFARALEPMLRTDVKMIWHCDGNLMEMVPRLLDCGLRGFQGFQYEHGMDYEAICKMKTRDGEDLVIIAGVSVTRTLPFGAPDDVRHELAWLVEHGPPTGLFLACSSTICPGTPWANVEALVEGFAWYRQNGRD
jgi:hypothetical protein